MAGNIAWTIRNRRGADYVYMQQDDGVSPNYLEALVAASREFPKASILYTEMKVHGSAETIVRHKPILGDAIPRALTHLERMDTSMFRGLIRRFALDRMGPLRVNAAAEN